MRKWNQTTIMNIFPSTSLRQEHSRIIRRALQRWRVTMHYREGSLWSVSSTADHPMDEKKICGTKRSHPPPDWPSGVSTTWSIPSTVTTGVTTQEETMSCQDADQLPYTLFAREATLSSTRCQPTMYPKRNRGNDWWQQRNIFLLQY